jgi:two-component system LytT family response regulator
MPEVNGFDVAASLPAPSPLVVFVTAYDDYAVRAFDASAVDYLLKPYDGERLQRAVQRVRERLQARRPQDAPPLAGQPVRQLLVTERGVTRIVRAGDISWLETADNYVVLHTPSGSPLLRQTLSGLLDSLGPGFIRCHRRAAVRLSCVARVAVDDKGDGELLLHDGGRVPLSRQHRAAVMAGLALSAASLPAIPPARPG